MQVWEAQKVCGCFLMEVASWESTLREMLTFWDSMHIKDALQSALKSN